MNLISGKQIVNNLRNKIKTSLFDLRNFIKQLTIVMSFVEIIKWNENAHKYISLYY
jgi:hypothetical protein